MALAERRARAELAIDSATRFPAFARDASAQSEDAELSARLRSEIASLQTLQAQAFVLTQLEGASYAEAAGALEIDASHVGVLVHRARQTLRRAFAADVVGGPR